MVGAHGLAQKIVHLRNAFDAGKSASRHDECQEALAAFGIAFRLRFFEHADELIAQIQRVTEILERTRVLAHAWNLRIIEPGPHGDHEMIVAQGEGRRPNARTQRYRARDGIDRLDVARIKICAGRHPPDRGDDMVEFNRARDHLRQQRLENDVVLPIDERDFGLFQFALREHLAKMDCDIDSAESAAKNENALLCHTNLGSIRKFCHRGSFVEEPGKLPDGNFCVLGSQPAEIFSGR